MGLKITVDKIEDVAEPHRSLYVERDGKFALDVEGLEDTSGLKSAFEKEKERRKELSAKLEALRGIDPEEYTRLKELEGKRFDASEELKRLTDKHSAREKELLGEKDRLLGEVRTMRLDDALKTAALAHGVHKDYVDDFVTILKTRHVRLDDNLKLQVIDADGDPSTQTLDGLMKDMKTKKPGYFEGSSASGGGSQQNRGGGAGEANPWKKESWNLTKQGEILEADPARAKALAAEAGKSIA